MSPTIPLGVNLPAHLVILKGTRRWGGGGEANHEASTTLADRGPDGGGGAVSKYVEYDRWELRV